MIDVVYEYHWLTAIPARDGRSRTKDEDERRERLRLLLESAEEGHRRWNRVGLVRLCELDTQHGRVKARLVEASAGGFRVEAALETPLSLSGGECVEVRIAEKSRPAFAASGGVVRIVEDKRAVASTVIDMPEQQVAFEKTEIGVEDAPRTIYRFPCRVVWVGAGGGGLELVGLPKID